MAVTNISPTRMQLKELKKKLVTARRGHKLLKDKRDELMRKFLENARESKELRLSVETALKKANENMAICCSAMSDESVEVALMMPTQRLSVEVSEKNVVGVHVPVFTSKLEVAKTGDTLSYGFAFTCSELDEAVKEYSSVSESLVRLAQLEKTAQLISFELERTRRRVNALEYVMIPQYEENIRYISMKLDEADRSNTTRLLKIKDMMLENAHNYTV